MKVKIRKKSVLKKYNQIHILNNTRLKKQAERIRKDMLESTEPLPFLIGDEISPFDRRFF